MMEIDQLLNWNLEYLMDLSKMMADLVEGYVNIIRCLVRTMLIKTILICVNLFL
ncbi:hypothetical protein [Holdemanella sp.]|uniref:hypothetical protein n=1 Tax=Holdemanella sp. TaxID=1971762 RepID=UPI003AF162A5